MKKYFLKQIILILTILLILSSGLLFLLNTEKGLHVSFTIASKIIPGKLTAQKLNGRLLGAINIDKLYFENKAISITVEKTHLEWKIKDLLLGKINITTLNADNIKINTKTFNTNKPKLTLKDIETKLKLGNIQLHNILWQQNTRPPLKIASVILQSHVTSENTLSLKAELHSQDALISIQGTLQKEWNVNWKLQLPNIKVFFQEAAGSLECEGKVHGDRNNPEIDANIKIAHFKYDNISFAKLQAKADIDLSNKKSSLFTLNFDSPKINSISFNQLVLLGNVSPKKQNTAININIDPTIISFPIAGDLQHLKLEKINVELNVRNIDNNITHQTTIHSGNGVLNLSGETLFSQDAVNSKILINGTNFLAVNTHEYKMIVSPQLILQTKDGALDLTGKIFISEAIIKPGYFSANNLLPTEVVYTKKIPAKKTEDLNLHTNIKLGLGDNVSIDIMGLKGKLQGELQLIDEPKKATKVFGTLYIKDANYNIYGQLLKVTRGDLHFFGGAIDNTEVNVEAIRDFKTVASDKELTVGIRMHGILDRAKIDLFSIPEGLSKPDILSYLIIGQPSKQASENKAQLLLQAASAINFGGTSEINNFLNTLREKLGFSEFGITEETRINKPQEITPSKPNQSTKPGDSLTTNTAFALGRYLTPKIYVGYSIGFLDPVNTFRVRYHMGKYWSIQTESSSLGSGADLIYTIERD